VIVAGLGRVGYRVVGLLRALDVPAVAIEEREESPFRTAVADGVPVLTGNARLVENLERAGVRQARAIIACTDDDITNLAACLEALQARPAIRTVARVGDDELADRLAGGFRLDLVASTTRIAASAFVAAAIDETARRSLVVDDLVLVAGRLEVRCVVARAHIEEWRGAGLRVLAREDADGRICPPFSAVGRDLEPGERLLVIAPAPVFDEARATASGRPAEAP
jgi:Trk K+ transport system NAD-binding subunit